MTQKEFANEQLEKIKELRTRIQNSFYFLEAEELNMTPSKGGWSILQCIEHINLTNHLYLRTFAQAVERSTDFTHEDDEYQMGMWGKLMTKAMKPKGDQIKWKIKTFNSLRPLNDKDPKARLVEQVVFEKFNEDMDALVKLIPEIQKLPWKKTRIQTALGKSVKIRIGDAIAFILAHTERHILQAEKILQ